MERVFDDQRGNSKDICFRMFPYWHGETTGNLAQSGDSENESPR